MRQQSALKQLNLNKLGDASGCKFNGYPTPLGPVLESRAVYMKVLNIHEAKTHFSKLIDSVLRGNKILIAMAGKPVAKLSPIAKKPERQFGVIKGKMIIHKDFDAPLSEDVTADFERGKQIRFFQRLPNAAKTDS